MMQGKFWALFHFIFLKFLKPQNPDFWYVPDTITSYSIWKQHKIFILVQDKKKIIQHQNSFALFLAITSKSNEEVEYAPPWLALGTMCDFHDFGLTFFCFCTFENEKCVLSGCTITSKTKINVFWNFFFTPSLLRGRSTQKNIKWRWF